MTENESIVAKLDCRNRFTVPKKWMREHNVHSRAYISIRPKVMELINVGSIDELESKEEVPGGVQIPPQKAQKTRYIKHMRNTRGTSDED